MLTSTPSLYAPFADAEANEASALKLFQSKVDEMPIPDSVEGFEMEEEDAKAMRKIHPEGEDAASEVHTLSLCHHLRRMLIVYSFCE